MAMSKPRVAVQLIIYGDRAQRDLAGVAAEVAAAGYAGIEGGAPTDSRQVAHMQEALQREDLAYAGGHCGLDQLKDLSAVEAMARSARDLGAGFLLVSGRAEGLDGYRAAAAMLSKAGGVCRDVGVTLCYHNHAWEFDEAEGTRPIHFLMEQTDPELVKLCPDVYWVHVGGEQPADFIARYRERCPYFHFKDGLAEDRSSGFLPLGQGQVGLQDTLKAALACRPKWITVEQDHTDGEPVEAIRASREYLRTLGL
jgi:sugar phosphate isomerase/epimerase